jgi:ABC-type branched-subunit amino acid transport system permease subunit
MFYWAAVILTALAFTITVFILRSRFGLFLQAIRVERPVRGRDPYERAVRERPVRG